MGTTVVVLLVTQKAYYIINVGDSRIYSLSDHKMCIRDSTYDARYKYKINTSDLKDTSYNVYVKAQDNCNGETAFFLSLIHISTIHSKLSINYPQMMSWLILYFSEEYTAC